MAKVILRTSLNNRNYYVEGKTINGIIGENLRERSFDLRISPSSGNVINSSEFTFGALPSLVNSLSFSQSGTNIIARVVLRDFVIKEDITNIYLPISGPARLPGGKVTISVSESVSSGVVTSGLTGTRSFDGKGGDNVFLFKKVFTPDQGYYFQSEPSYNITGNNSGYTIAKQKIKDSIAFSVYYKFPSELTSVSSVDNISFNAIARKQPIDATTIEFATKKEDYRIYSIDTGPKVSSKGGVKKIVVKGVPGTPFKILVQDTAKKVYNSDTGTFEDGGSFIEGVVPYAQPGVNFGEYRTFINVPASTTANSITSRIYVDNPVTTFGVSAPGKSTEATDVSTTTPVIEEAMGSLAKATFSMSTTSSNLIVTRSALQGETGDGVTNGTHIIGTSDRGSNISDYLITNPIIYKDGDSTLYMSWTITPNSPSSNSLRICRTPLYSPTTAFAAWGASGDDDAKKYLDAAGNTIVNDWEETFGNSTFDNSNWNITSITTTITGDDMGVDGPVTVETIGFETHSKVFISAQIEGTFGSTDITPKLRLHNVLAIA